MLVINSRTDETWEKRDWDDFQLNQMYQDECGSKYVKISNDYILCFGDIGITAISYANWVGKRVGPMNVKKWSGTIELRAWHKNN